MQLDDMQVYVLVLVRVQQYICKYMHRVLQSTLLGNVSNPPHVLGTAADVPFWEVPNVKYRHSFVMGPPKQNTVNRNPTKIVTKEKKKK